jgi:hypothetical protein
MAAGRLTLFSTPGMVTSTNNGSPLVGVIELDTSEVPELITPHAL